MKGFDEDSYIENLHGAPYNENEDGECACPSCRAAERRRAREEKEIDDDYEETKRRFK